MACHFWTLFEFKMPIFHWVWRSEAKILFYVGTLEGCIFSLLFSIQIQLTYFITYIFFRLVQVGVKSSFSTMLPSLSYASTYLVFHFSFWLCFPLCCFGRFGKRRRMGGNWTTDLPVAVRALYPLDHGDTLLDEFSNAFFVFHSF